MAWATGQSSAAALSYGDGTGSNSGEQILYETIETGSDWEAVRTVYRHTYPSHASYTANYGSCCYISGINNLATDSWDIKAVIDLRSNTDNLGGPATTLPILMRLRNSALENIALPLIDPDPLDLISCVNDFHGQASTPSGFTLTSDCKFSLDLRSTSVGTKYVIVFDVVTSTLSGADRMQANLIIEVVAFVPNPECTEFATDYMVSPGQSISVAFGVDVDDNPKPSVTFEGALGGPSGAITSVATGASFTPPVQFTYDWTAQESDRGESYLVSVKFVTSSGGWRICPFAINVPQVIPDICTYDLSTTTEEWIVYDDPSDLMTPTPLSKYAFKSCVRGSG